MDTRYVGSVAEDPEGDEDWDDADEDDLPPSGCGVCGAAASHRRRVSGSGGTARVAIARWWDLCSTCEGHVVEGDGVALTARLRDPTYDGPTRALIVAALLDTSIAN